MTADGTAEPTMTGQRGNRCRFQT